MTDEKQEKVVAEIVQMFREMYELQIQEWETKGASREKIRKAKRFAAAQLHDQEKDIRRRVAEEVEQSKKKKEAE